MPASPSGAVSGKGGWAPRAARALASRDSGPRHRVLRAARPHGRGRQSQVADPTDRSLTPSGTVTFDLRE